MDLSDSCKDLITKLLTPDKKTRIKVKEIFQHPWVVGFEKDYMEKFNSIKKKGESSKQIEPTIEENKESHHESIALIPNSQHVMGLHHKKDKEENKGKLM